MHLDPARQDEPHMNNLIKTLFYLCLLHLVLSGVAGFFVWERFQATTPDPLQNWLTQGSAARSSLNRGPGGASGQSGGPGMGGQGGTSPEG